MSLRRACRAVSCLLLFGTTSALASWAPNGNLVGPNSSNPAYLAVAPDGSGGALLAWQQLGQGAQNDVYAQRIDANGNPLWGPNGIAVCDTTGYQSDPAIVSDGSGGAIVVWSDGRDLVSRSPLYTQRISAAGTAMWTPQGIRMSGANSYQEVPSLTTDGAGGAVAVWMDTRFGDYDIMTQRVESNGTISWGLGDRIVTFTTGRQTGPQIVRDGAGGYVVVWTDTRNGGDFDFDIYANRLNSNGLYSWAQNGVPVCVDPNTQFNPQLVPDNTGGAIFVWEDYRATGDIYAQRINGLNVVQWAANGIAVCNAGGSQDAPQVAADGAGGMFLGWHDARNGNYDIYVQHLNPAGASAWTANGVAACTAPGNQLNPRVVPNGAGGLVVAWGDARSGLYSDLYVERVSSNGALTSGGGGLPLAVADYDQQVPKLVPDPSGGAIIAWEDKRYNGAYPQIYAQRFLVATTAIAEESRNPFLGLTSAPNPFHTSTEIKFTISRPGNALLEVFDLSGRKVRTLQFQAKQGMNEIRLHREDLASGLYFYRVSVPGFSETRKLVVTN